MPRRSRPRREASPAADGGPPGRLIDQVETASDGDWIVRTISGAGATKTYRCPGCDHEIRPATPHLVVWPSDDPEALDRRHWHRTCWRSRSQRNPGRSRW
ncbi:MAG: hypothetical protein M3446_02700 [Actinomycetota bacterium]|nr:hypothetical protein [Actinomycetota bacterium]